MHVLGNFPNNTLSVLVTSGKVIKELLAIIKWHTYDNKQGVIWPGFHSHIHYCHSYNHRTSTGKILLWIVYHFTANSICINNADI